MIEPPISLILRGPCVNPGECAIEAFDLVDQDEALIVGATRSLGGDDEIGIVRIGFYDPGSFQHRINELFALGDANQDARRTVGRLNGGIIVEPALEPPQRLGRSHRPVVELEIAIGSPRPQRAHSSRRIQADEARQAWR